MSTDYRKKLLDRIDAIPAVYCPDIFMDFTIRGDVNKVLWNKKMMEDEGFPLERFRELVNLAENRMNMRLIG